MLNSTVKLAAVWPSPPGPGKNSQTMKNCAAPFHLLPFATALIAFCAAELSAQTYIAAEDSAVYGAYSDGWQTGDVSGRGFGPWKLYAPDYVDVEEEQYAGFFIAEAELEADLGQSALDGKAFGIFANGTGFEETVAFRALNQALNPGDTFSCRLEFDGFKSKFDRDSTRVSSVGIAFRASPQANSLGELVEGRLLVLAVIEGLSTYQILDAESRLNTRVFIDPEGVELGLTPRGNGSYDLQLITLSDQVRHDFPGRAFKVDPNPDPATPESAIHSFALFNLNGGASNAYFGAFQISRQETER